MATTTNYSWSTPDDTALVKDGAAAIRSLGTAIDTTVFNNAGAAIAKAIVDGKGDLIAGTGDNTVARLAVGTNGQVLVAASGEATGLQWATPAGGGKVLQVVQSTSTTNTTSTSTSYVDVNMSVTITPSSATSKILVFHNGMAYLFKGSTDKDMSIQLLRGATQISEQKRCFGSSPSGDITGALTMCYLDSPATTSATTYKIQAKVSAASVTMIYLQDTSMGTITAMEIGA